MWHKAESCFLKHQRFLLTTHVDPDGDGIGSACALIELLLYLGKDPYFIYDDILPSKFAFLDFHKRFHSLNSEDTHFKNLDVVIVLDTQDPKRIGHVLEIAKRDDIHSICIDHHPVIDSFVDTSVIDPKECCVGAILFSLFEHMKIPLNKNAAKGIYTSLICDTDHFSNSATTHKTHEIAEKCIQLGVDPDKMNIRLFQKVTMAQMKHLTKSLQNIEIYHNNRTVIQELRLSDYNVNDTNIRDVEQMQHDFHRSIAEVECVVILRELPNGLIRVSIRTKSNLDIGALMRRVGGGGHNRAAGVAWKGPIEDVKERILKLLAEGFSEISNSPQKSKS